MPYATSKQTSDVSVGPNRLGIQAENRYCLVFSSSSVTTPETDYCRGLCEVLLISSAELKKQSMNLHWANKLFLQSEKSASAQLRASFIISSAFPTCLSLFT